MTTVQDPTVSLMVCGCPFDTSHRPACWMGEVEAIADEAASAAELLVPPRHRVIAALTALNEAGHLRDVAGGGALFAVLDGLTELGLLGPASGVEES